MTTAVRRAGWLVLLVVLWEAASRLGPWPSWVLPAPSQVSVALVDLARRGVLLESVLRTLGRLFAGYGAALMAGIPLGLLLARNRAVDEALGSAVLGLQALPSVCWLPVAILWFGLSEWAVLFVTFMGSVLSVTLASEAGVKNLSPLFVRAGRTLGAGGLKLYTTILLPASLPALLSGAKLGWTFAWRSLMAAELLYVSGGLGQLLQLGRDLNDVAAIFAVMVIIIAVGLLTEKVVFSPLERRVRRRFGTDRE